MQTFGDGGWASQILSTARYQFEQSTQNAEAFQILGRLLQRNEKPRRDPSTGAFDVKYRPALFAGFQSSMMTVLEYITADDVIRWIRSRQSSGGFGLFPARFDHHIVAVLRDLAHGAGSRHRCPPE